MGGADTLGADDGTDRMPGATGIDDDGYEEEELLAIGVGLGAFVGGIPMGMALIEGLPLPDTDGIA